MRAGGGWGCAARWQDKLVHLPLLIGLGLDNQPRRDGHPRSESSAAGADNDRVPAAAAAGAWCSTAAEVSRLLGQFGSVGRLR